MQQTAEAYSALRVIITYVIYARLFVVYKYNIIYKLSDGWIISNAASHIYIYRYEECEKKK